MIFGLFLKSFPYIGGLDCKRAYDLHPRDLAQLRAPEELFLSVSKKDEEKATKAPGGSWDRRFLGRGRGVGRGAFGGWGKTRGMRNQTWAGRGLVGPRGDEFFSFEWGLLV